MKFREIELLQEAAIATFRGREGGWGGGVLLSNRLMGMCRWMGWYFHG